jgi:hypothetical protein
MVVRKYAILVSVSSFSGINKTLEYMEWVTESIGFDVIGKIGILSHLINSDNKNNIVKMIKKIYGHFFHLREINIRLTPGLKKLLIFKDQKKRIMRIKDKYHKAYKYWEDNRWLDKIYFNDVKINPIKKIILKFLNISI